jgi:hypothetical protein
MLVMMALDRALAGSAASGGVRRPCGCGKRGEKKNNRKEADDCTKRAPAVLMPNGHANPKLPKSYAKRGSAAADRPEINLRWTSFSQERTSGRYNFRIDRHSG